MSKLLGFTAFAVISAVAVSIASLVLNIIILTRINSINNTPINDNNNTVTTPAPAPANDTKYCPNVGAANDSLPWRQAAAYLLNGLDQSVDPCEDFYAFTCNKFIAGVNLTALDESRLGTYDQAQVDVNSHIASTLKKVDVNDDKNWSATERITKAALDACVINSNLEHSLDYSKQILADIKSWFGGVPFLNQALKDKVDIFAAVGAIEQTHALGTLLASWASVDYKNVAQNALYVSQPSLSMPRDFYTLPQFVDKLDARAEQIEKVMQVFASDVVDDPGKYNDTIKKASKDVASFEAQIAMASWPDEEMRASNELLSIHIRELNPLHRLAVVLSQPSYFAWLNAIFAGNTEDQTVIVNYVITQLLFDDFTFIGGAYRNVIKEANYVPYAQRRGRGVTRVGRRFTRKFDDEDPAVGCVDMIMAYMPYGPGYVYVKSMEGVRDQVVKDITHQTELVISNFQTMITTLDWMTQESKDAAKYKSDHLLKNYGWPTALFGDFKDSSTIDLYHKADYNAIIAAYNNNKTDFYTIMNILKAGLENREAFRLLVAPDNKGDRSNFLQSPAMVNAWYQPERNSITFPYAIWNPPYYNLQYPQAYNYAGQGGTGGHELTHGFDDEGVQFGWDGSLMNCTWNHCGWMDATSKTGFTNMAQCVVSQYSTQCCPEKNGNVHCANGATTQGENIADLGGETGINFIKKVLHFLVEEVPPHMFIS
ncbi:Zinc metallopeptidase [Trichostrongylus colubriformis]|uniref:Zinc metallopeptidase n=1 Tax=Trichostrongylus colubriformis TaxID=6319 RepID=A0AAN8F0I3_TRICO